jgi:hypothetical protein
MGACVPFLPMPAWHLRSIKYRSLSLRRGDLRGKSTRITEGAKHVRAWDKQEICELYDCAHRQGSPRREHHALGFVSNSVCSDFVSNKRNPGNGLFETSVFVVSCARLCRNRTVPALRSGCACSLPSVGIAHLTSLNSPCLTGHIASTTNDKLYLSSASVLFLLADANSSYTIFFGTPIFFGVRPGACLSDSSPHHTQCTQTFIPHARIHLSAHAPRQPDISCFLVMLHRSPPSRRLPSRPPHRPPRHPSSVQ